MSNAIDSASKSSNEPRFSGSRFRGLATSAVVVLCALIIGYLLGLLSGRSYLLATRALLQQTQSENQSLKSENVDANAKLAESEANLTNVRAALEALTPKKNAYNLTPNQSLIVADGRLTIGLVGPPANESVKINVNGNQHSAAPGDVIRIALDPATNCQVSVQSFDMFNAVVTASCAGTKAQ